MVNHPGFYFLSEHQVLGSSVGRLHRLDSSIQALHLGVVTLNVIPFG